MQDCKAYIESAMRYLEEVSCAMKMVAAAKQAAATLEASVNKDVNLGSFTMREMRDSFEFVTFGLRNMVSQAVLPVSSINLAMKDLEDAIAMIEAEDKEDC